MTRNATLDEFVNDKPASKSPAGNNETPMDNSEADPLADSSVESQLDASSDEESWFHGGDPSDELTCPCLDEGIEYCRQNIDEGHIDAINVDKIGCGYGMKYIANEAGATLAWTTAEGYSSNLRQFVEFLHSKQVTVVDADISYIKRYFNRMAKLNRAENTLAHYRTVVTGLYKYIELYTDEEIEFDYRLITEEITPSEFQTPEARERDFLEKWELKQLYESLGTFRNRLMAQTGAELGPRNVDICELKVPDVVLEENHVDLSNTKSGGSYILPISNLFTLLLRRWINVERSQVPGASEHNYLFPSVGGGCLNPGGFNQFIKEAAEDAGIQEKTTSKAPMSPREKETLGTDKDYKDHHRVTPHALRHTFNYLLHEAGVPREARAEALDHESEEVTKEFYDHWESDFKELMEELYSNHGSLLDE